MSARRTLSNDDAYGLLAFLLSSAELCTVEPGYYGSFRLTEAASRLMDGMLKDADSDHDWLAQLKRELDERTKGGSPSLWMADRDGYIAAIQSAIRELATEMKRRSPAR